MEQFHFPNNTPEDKPNDPPKEEKLTESPATPERKERPPESVLEKENEFDDLWVVSAEKLGYSTRADETGRILEKDGITIKLQHRKFRSGIIKYLAIFTDTTSSPAKTSTFTFDYKKAFTPKGIATAFEKQLAEYNETRKPMIMSAVALTEAEMGEIIKASETYDPEKQVAIDAYRILIEQGVTNPDDLDPQNPAVIAANGHHSQWISNMEKREDAADSATKPLLALEATLFYLDAGFTDPAYAEEILFDEAQQTLESVENAPEVRKKIIDTIKFYHQKLLPNYQWDYKEDKEF